MTPEQFIYWLKGFIEIDNPKNLDSKKVKIIKDHLDLVFNKVTPKYYEFDIKTRTNVPVSKKVYC